MLDKNELQKVITGLAGAQFVEDVFGDWKVPNIDKLSTAYRMLVRPIFPDHYRTRPDLLVLAEEAFKLLGNWKTLAEDRIKDGTYGKRDYIKPVKLVSKSGAYEVRRRYRSGDIAEFYLGVDLKDDREYLFKVVRSPKNNDLMAAELSTLQKIHAFSAGSTNPVASAVQHIPYIITGFEAQFGKEKKRINVFKAPDKDDCNRFFSLADVIKQYPAGIDAADMAWMFNRMLGALMITHAAGIVHGAITPENILLRARDHHGMLINWVYSVPAGETVKAIIPSMRSLYPREILDKKPVSAATDIYMLARSMICVLMGGYGNILDFARVFSVPSRIRGLLMACTLESQAKRPEDVVALFQEFREVLRSTFGPPKFRPFAMPSA
jgi:serine/threonine protein kinase